mmetsp:Transcript_9210/g.22947  ORF Transcript_9210/g.22947 Transcript_9210/m.22947 type:complete len:243 (+) Transcript_9210:1379-2107(+)
MIEDSRGVDDLPPHVVVVQVADEERLCGEGVGLHIYASIGDYVHEGRLSYVRIASKDQCARRGVDRRQPAQVLPHFLKVRERPAQLLHRSAHAAQRSPLEHLALVQAVSKLHHLHVVLGDAVDYLLGRIDLTQCQLVVVAVVQHVAKICVERVDVVNLREVLQDLAEFLPICCLTELHLPHVEAADPRDLKARLHNRRSLPVCFGQDDVHQLLGRGDGLNLFELVHAAHRSPRSRAGLTSTV